MTTIGELINKNINTFRRASRLDYFIFGTFSKNFLVKPINISVSRKKGGFILKINGGKLVIMINNFINNKRGGKKSKKNGKKSRSKKSKKRKGRVQKGGELIPILIAILGIYLSHRFWYERLIVPKIDNREMVPNSWEIGSTDSDFLFKNVPTLHFKNDENIPLTILNNSLTRGLTSNNKVQTTNLPKNLTLRPLSYAEFNISRLPAHTEMMNMIKNVSFPNVTTYKKAGKTFTQFRIFGNWRLSNSGLVNIELLDPPRHWNNHNQLFKFPNRQDIEDRIINFVIETIRIQKKIGMIRDNENEGQFRLGLANFPPLGENVVNPVIHYDTLEYGKLRHDYRTRDKAYTGRNPVIGGIVSLMYPEANEISQPSIVVDEEGNPIADHRQITEYGELMDDKTKTKYIEGTPTTGNVQMHDQEGYVKHEITGKKLKKRRFVNLMIMPVNLKDSPFTYRLNKRLRG